MVFSPLWGVVNKFSLYRRQPENILLLISMKISVIGLGYVGLSTALMMSKNNEVIGFDIDKNKISHLKEKKFCLDSTNFTSLFDFGANNITFTDDPHLAYSRADYVIFALPTNFENQKNSLDTECLESSIKLALSTPGNPCFVIKSTVPVGFTKRIIKETHCQNFLYVPEFLRESNALYDTYYPSRIVTGLEKNDTTANKHAKDFLKLIKQGCLKKNIKSLFVGTDEAESIKLFSNAYLAMRIAFFNELDSFALKKGIESESIIKGVCFDPRIGFFYNNPSFGYGGYCLTKDVKQLIFSYGDIPENLIKSIDESNLLRKEVIANEIIRKIHKIKKPVVGIYRLIAKSSGASLRNPAVKDVIKILKQNFVEIIAYEPFADCNKMYGVDIEDNLDLFLSKSDLIIANRYDHCLDVVRNKVFSRDIFEKD